MRQQKIGVFALEGEWNPKLNDPETVKPLLDFVEASGRIEVIHYRVATPDAFADYATRWGQKQYQRYLLGYFGFHGTPGTIYFGRGRSLTLVELGDLLKDKCKGKILYFGSCETLRVKPREIEMFRRQTGARAIVGYVKEVDWFEGAAFELLLLDAMTWYRRTDAMENWIWANHRALAKKVGFKMYRPPSRQPSATIAVEQRR